LKVKAEHAIKSDFDIYVKDTLIFFYRFRNKSINHI